MGRCPVCDGVLGIGERGVLCEKCLDKPEYVVSPFCIRCGKPLSDAMEEYCSDCKNRKLSFECGRSAFVYEKNLKSSMYRFKYGGRREYSEFYGRTMLQMYGNWIKEIAPDAIIPVPIHKKRYIMRGYNQAELIAKVIGKEMEIPVVTDVILRTGDTLPQKELNKEARMENLIGAFAVSEYGKALCENCNCVIIIDDIYTTGSTMEACSRLLRQSGISNVFFMCVCIGKAE